MLALGTLHSSEACQNAYLQSFLKRMTHLDISKQTLTIEMLMVVMLIKKTKVTTPVKMDLHLL